MTNEYDRGDLIRCSAAFTDAAGAAADPTAVTFRWKAESAAATSYVYGTDDELVKDGTGEYHVDLTPVASGVYFYRFEGTGAIVAADEAHFKIRASEF